NFEAVAGRERVDSAEFQDAFRAVLETAENGEQIRNDNFVPLADPVQDFAAGKDAGDIAEPALEDFDVNTERENVETANLNPLPPMRRRVSIQISAGQTLQPDAAAMAEIIIREQLIHDQIRSQPERRRPA